MKGKISENFTYEEFEKSDKAEELGIDNSIPTMEIAMNIKALVEEVLQPLRDAMGFPLSINSGYRCPLVNNAVGGQPKSQHLRGEAADVKCKRPLAVASAAMISHLPYDQCIVYPTFVHFSHKRKGTNRHEMLYSDAFKKWLEKKRNENHR